MNIKEYGTDNKETILLLHGGGLSWWNYTEVAEIHVCVGEKETREILRSAELISKSLPSCRLHRMKGLKHGEFSINHADKYAKAILTLCSS